MSRHTEWNWLVSVCVAVQMAFGCNAGVGGSPAPARVVSESIAGRAANVAGAPAAAVNSAGAGSWGTDSAGALAVSGAAGSGLTPAAIGGAQAAVCGRDKYRAEPAPLTVYTLFDDSGSMLLWWGPVTDAFTRFVRDPRSAGINIGLKFFGDDCDPATYSKPEIAIGPLPQNAEPIANLLANHVPWSQTPTRQAMQGALLALDSYAANHPNDKTVILLVTDASTGLFEGDEADCYSTVQQASEVAAMAWTGASSIQTYVLGLGDAASLNMLSRAGGTGEAFGADPAASDKVVEAMQQIRKRALPCDYALPSGAEQNPKLVNLEFAANGGSTQTIPGVSGASACQADKGGWYYDEPAHPKRIIACPTTCSAFNTAGEVNVVLGCPTIGPD